MSAVPARPYKDDFIDTPARWPELTNTPDMAHTKRLAFASWVMATYLPICDDIMEANNAPAWAFA